MWHQSVGKGLAELRKRRRYTQQELADRAELSRSMVQQIEGGQSKPSLAALERLLDALGASLGDLAEALGQSDRLNQPVEQVKGVAGALPASEVYPVLGSRITRTELERRLDAALDRFVREALEAAPEVTAEEIHQRRRQPKPAGVRDD